MKKLLNSLFAIFLLSAFIVPLVASSKAYAAEAHPLIAPCTPSTVGQVTYVNVPSGTERWLCNNVPFIVGGRYVATSRWTAQLVSPKISEWTNYNSGMEMDVTDGSISQGKQIIQWPYNAQPNQQWNMVYDVRYNTAFLVGNNKSNLCLGVQGGSLSQGAAVVQWACNGNNDQDWIWAYAGFMTGGWPVWDIIDYNSHLCIGIEGGSTSAAATAIQWSCDNPTNQEWY